MASSTSNEQLEKYLNEFEEKEKKALKIAQEHLATSFNIVKSNGFNEWKKNKQSKINSFSISSSSSSFFCFAVFDASFLCRRVIDVSICSPEFINASGYSLL